MSGVKFSSKMGHECLEEEEEEVEVFEVVPTETFRPKKPLLPSPSPFYPRWERGGGGGETVCDPCGGEETDSPKPKYHFPQGFFSVLHPLLKKY